MAARPVVQFDGNVEARAASGAIGLVLRGTAGGRRLELLFSGLSAALPQIPASLQAVRVRELGQSLFRIEATEGQYLVAAGSVQLHAETGARFFSVLPPTRVTAARRWGWALLLWLLRLLPLQRSSGQPGGAQAPGRSAR
jgi:hypothetical protein